MEVYRKAIELDPAFAPMHENLASILFEIGRFEEAFEAMGKFSRLAPDGMPPEIVEQLRAGYADGGVEGFWEASLRSASARVQDLGTLALPRS